MNCKKNIELYLNQEDINFIPIKNRIHMLFCKKCKREVKLLQKNMLSFKNKSPFTTNDMSSMIMNKILVAQKSENFSHVSIWAWLFSGSTIILGTVFISFSKTFILLKYRLGENIGVPIYISLGIIITIFSVLLVGTNLEKMKNFFRF